MKFSFYLERMLHSMKKKVLFYVPKELQGIYFLMVNGKTLHEAIAHQLQIPLDQVEKDAVGKSIIKDYQNWIKTKKK